MGENMTIVEKVVIEHVRESAEGYTDEDTTFTILQVLSGMRMMILLKILRQGES